MGALTGGFFGDFISQLLKLINPESTFVWFWPTLFTPLEDTMMILVGAMALGFVQILVGMAISFVKKLRRGQVMDAIWEEVTWWVVFAGLALAILGVTNLVIILGGVMVVAGPILTEKGFGKITGIFGSLYNHVTGYFGDILSYSRLMALSLIHIWRSGRARCLCSGPAVSPPRRRWRMPSPPLSLPTPPAICLLPIS